MSISGNLRTMELAELLQWLSQGEKSGTLIVDSGEITKRVYFQDGKIVASGSSEPSEQLGHFLVSHSFINEVELQKAIEMQEETGMLLGKILVTIGAITAEELKELLITQTEEIIFELFAWREAEFRFVDGDTIDRAIIPLTLDVHGIILHGMNRLDQWNRIREVVPTDGAIPVLVGSFEDVDLTPSEQRIVEAIDDDRNVRELCLHTHSSEFHVSEVLFEQLRAGRLKVVAVREAEPPTPRDVTFSERPAVTAAVLMEHADALLAEQEYKKTLRYLRAARSLEPDNQEIGRQIKDAEGSIQQSIQDDGLDIDSVPVLERGVEELTTLKLSPEEGFLLTRIDGATTIQSLLKISPIDRLDAQLVFFKLLKEGHIRLEAR